MNDKNDGDCEPEKLEVLLNFLKLTKEGKYSRVDLNQSNYPMVEEETVEDTGQTCYFYGIR
ncbi:MAG TPA: hypothetical protein VKM55_02090 [Candidatus Lokiarchaeia archaeon]|nr:hypothetical protein [Candidatus Lokiarchaeia archaeon]